jgi:hypothetical protein
MEALFFMWIDGVTNHDALCWRLAGFYKGNYAAVLEVLIVANVVLVS